MPGIAGCIAKAGARLGVEGKSEIAKIDHVLQVAVGQLMFAIYYLQRAVARFSKLSGWSGEDCVEPLPRRSNGAKPLQVQSWPNVRLASRGKVAVHPPPPPIESEKPAMKSTIIAYFSAAIAMLALDSVWLVLTADRLYRANLGDLMMPGFNLVPAGLFYLIYLMGITVLAIQPALASGRATTAMFRGAVLGFVAYATYDLTNQATLRDWSTVVTVADLCWGTFLTASAASFGYWVSRRFVASAR